VRKEAAVFHPAVLLPLVAVLWLGATILFAGHQTGAVTSYTGCLNQSSGTLTSIAPGDAPLSACTATQLQVHLSGGDLTGVTAGQGLTGGGTTGTVELQVDATQIPTSVSAGYGLTGGGTGGDITLAVDPTVIQRRITSTCASGLGGRAISDVGENGVTTCSVGPLALFGGKNGPEDLPEDLGQIAALPLPSAGDWLVIVKLVATASHPLEPLNDYMDTLCLLQLGNQEDRARIQGDTDVKAGGTMTLMIAAHLDATGDAVLQCADQAASDNPVAQMEFTDLKMTAVRLDNVFNQPPF
jgi:hypothetical protein